MTAIALYGSGEFMPWSREVDDWCLSATDATGGDRVLIVPTAASPEGLQTFERWGALGIEHYEAQGLAPEVLPVHTRSDADRDDLAERVSGARLIFFSGGNPGYLAEALEGTAFWRAVLHAVAGGTALAGCSAGAVILGTLAPYVNGADVMRWVPGLKLLSRAYVSPHFDQLDSYGPNLKQLVMGKRPTGSDFVGIDEETAFCGDGTAWQVLGRRSVWVGEDLAQHTAGASVGLPLGLELP